MFQGQTQDGYPINVPFSFHSYNIIKYLGCGSTCVVLLVQDQNSNQLFSAKIMARKDIENRNMVNSICNEVKVLQMINHPHIIKLIEFFEIKNQFEEEYYVMITEYCPNGDLLTYATTNGFKSESEKKKIIQGFLQAIAYLHANGISHGDIKSENILLDQNWSPKLCDFGFCRISNVGDDHNKNGTLYYAAPELFQKGLFDTFKSDIYAIGITLYSLSELQFPFRDGDQNFIVKQIVSGCLSIRSNMDQILKKLVTKCTSMDPKKRPSIEDILHDDYFTCEKQYPCKINNFSTKDWMNIFNEKSNDDDFVFNSFDDMTRYEF